MSDKLQFVEFSRNDVGKLNDKLKLVEHFRSHYGSINHSQRN
jgi:hypothetical protein